MFRKKSRVVRKRHRRGAVLETLESKRYFSVNPAFETEGVVVPTIIPSYAEHIEVSTSDDGHDGVVGLYEDGKFNCSGTLLPTGKHVLTAAHCLTAEGTAELHLDTVTSVQVESSSGRVTFDVVDEIVHPDWNGNVVHGNDIAILELSEEVWDEVPRHDISRDSSNDVGTNFEKVGYGLTGAGSTGYDEVQAYFQQQGILYAVRHAGENTYESTAQVLREKSIANVRNSDKQLVYDFDDGQLENNILAAYGVSSSLGLGDAREANATHGDSGGPSFVNQEIVGVTSYGLGFERGPHQGKGINGAFGAISVDTRVSSFADWVDSQLPGPRLSGVEVTESMVVTNRREVTLSLKDSRLDLARVRFLVNDSVLSYSTTEDGSYVVSLPNIEGTHEVTVELTYSDGESKTASTNVEFVKPKLSLNNGSLVTSTGRVSFEFSDLASDAESIQVLVNGHKEVDWTPTSTSPLNELRLNWIGTNYIQGKIRYADGQVKTIYRSIVHARANLEINGGAQITNTGHWMPELVGLDETAERVRFKINGSHVGGWQAVDGTFDVPRLTYRGTNYFQAEIEYAGGITKTLYSKIDYVRPSLVLNHGSDSTSTRTIDIAIENLDPSAVAMRVVTNSTNFASAERKAIASDFSTTLPSWYGRNWVNVQIEYANGSKAWIYGSITLE